MARYDSFIKFKGTLGGLTFFEGQHGEAYVKEKNRSYQPKAPGTLQNNKEFGGGSTLCKHFRYSFLRTAKQFTGQDTCGRLNGRFRNVIYKGRGILGQREFDLKSHSEFLIGFQFEKFWSVRQALSEPLLDLEMRSERDLVRWQVPSFVPRQAVTAPITATHFQLVLVGTQVSPGAYNALADAYEQVVPVRPHSGGMAYSVALPLTAETIDAFTLEVVPGLHLPTHDAMSVVVCAGVLFGHVVNGQFVMMKEGRALDVFGVG